MPCSVFGNEAPHQSTISRWYGEFKRGRLSLSDDPRENVDTVCKLIIEDRHVTYREIETSLKISKTSLQKNLHEELGVRKLVSHWLLTEDIVSGDESWIYCEEKPTKVIRSQSVSEKMVATFVSKAGHIATIPLNEQITVTADWYTTIYNASSHTAQKIRQYLTPNLSPNDFFTFPKTKNRRRGQRFQSPEEAVDAFKMPFWIF
ncbi:unnamed protein product [Acanthoscelides obtectus]|uniref:Transposase n=1 Tax=Acanthoscelides obtectus TaxID=200917 RepID=A0A9P0QAQ0_ACAOB|nr:unnamed protein product [Acanthoscelides obtectus]CAK1629492.1 hypothetical protein AOBTE_LOCUS5777 [Acanthoscelides obtectus]